MPRMPRNPAVPSPTDVFGWLDALWNKQHPPGTPPVYMMHRFLASDVEFAQVARELALTIREAELVFGVWQALLPQAAKAPRLAYAAAKKPPAAEALVARLQVVLCAGRAEAEAAVAMVRSAGQLAALYAECGLVPPEVTEGSGAGRRPRGRASQKRGR
jgi:hypothetical protein